MWLEDHFGSGSGDGRSAAGGGTRTKNKGPPEVVDDGPLGTLDDAPLLVPPAQGVAGLTRDGEVCSCAVFGWSKNEARRMLSTTGLEFWSIDFHFGRPAGGG